MVDKFNAGVLYKDVIHPFRFQDQHSEVSWIGNAQTPHVLQQGPDREIAM